ncbi:MAG: guanylate kinase [Clostridia bacterium]|nr:guanylate kinase [Clostridia bacterium]
MCHEGLLVVFCGPSGVGKGSVLKIAKEGNANIKYSVSATTRNPRQGETDGESYYFKTIPEFKEMIANDELVEWVEYCGNFYGTPKKCIDDALREGYNIILEIEVEGAVNIKNKYPDAVTVFVLPPSFEELQKRLEGRGTEKPDVIEKRLCRAKEEMSFINKFDYIIINDDINNAVSDFNNILAAEKLRYKRNTDILSRIGVINDPK